SRDLVGLDPAGMHSAVQRVLCLRIEVAHLYETTERRLDMAGRTAEPVIDVEMAESGVEIVAPQQADNAPAEPDAFGGGRRAAQHLLGFREFVDLLLVLAFARRRTFTGLGIGALCQAWGGGE